MSSVLQVKIGRRGTLTCLAAVSVSIACTTAPLPRSATPLKQGQHPPNLVHPSGSWAIAATGDYQGHHWVRYVAPGTSGVCYALDIDGRAADTIWSASTPTSAPAAAISAPPTPPDTSLLYQGHVPSCGLLKGVLSSDGFTVENATPIDLMNGQRQATATDFGYVSGIVPQGTAVVATLDDGSKQTVTLANHTFTLFYGPGRKLTHMGTIDSTGKMVMNCTVSTTPPFDGMSSVVSDC